MPAKSAAQQHYMGMEYGKAKAGQPSKTGMSVKKLREMSRKPKRSYVR